MRGPGVEEFSVNHFKRVTPSLNPRAFLKLQVGIKLKIISKFLKMWKCNGNSAVESRKELQNLK